MKHSNSPLKAILSLFVCLGLLNLSACTKDDEEQASRSQLIIGTWKLSAFDGSPAFDYDNNGTVESNIFPLLQSCEKDNLVKFMTDGTLQWDEGPTKCDSSDPQLTTGKWSLSNNDQTLIADGDTLSIVQLDNTTLKFSFPQQENGKTVTITLTYTRQ